MARVIICDRCGAIIYKDSDSHTIKVGKTIYEQSPSKSYSHFHLCENCFSNFIKKFMNIKNEESDG